jgi:hypothetical protein
VAAHERARQLDSTIATGGYQALWQLGFEDRALREGVRPYLIQAIVTGMRGDTPRALELLREVEAQGPTRLARNLMATLRAVFEGRRDQALEHAKQVFEACPDPEALYFVGRAVAFFGEPRALFEFGRALERGFVVYRVLLRDDSWLDPLRSTSEFQILLERSREAYLECRQAYLEAGGERLLVPLPRPEELERRVPARAVLPKPGGSP